MKSVGLIGCGSIANISYSTMLSTWFKGSGKYFYDINAEAAGSLSHILSGKSVPLDELIQKSDFIIIAAPPAVHHELLIKAIQPRKTILCEKPFLLEYSHAKEVVERAHAANAHVFAAHVRRLFPALNLAKKFLETGLLGAVKKIEIFEGSRFSWESQSGYHYKNPFGGVLPDTGSHSIDSMMFVLGLDSKVADFKILTRNRIPDKEPSHVFDADFSIESNNINTSASIHLSRRTFLANKMNIFCESGIMEVPMDVKNAVKVSTGTGTTILRENHPIRNIDDAFNHQFDHIINGGGQMLKASLFLNTTKLLEHLLAISE